MGDLACGSKPVVLVTGFGPFGIHKVNASWKAVQELEKLACDNEFNLVIEEIPVVYKTVQDVVPTLWEKYKPNLTIHVGVSAIASKLTLEQQGHNDGYDKFDVENCCPEGNHCIEGSADCIASSIDMTRVCREINESGCGVIAEVSYDPGRYLCDFIYFTSLNINRQCVAFIHVPPLEKPYSAQELAKGIYQAIIAMLQQTT